MKRLPYILAALIFAYFTKRWYSHATAESLRWILEPTSWAVGALYRSPFHFVPGYGHLSRALDFAIVPACAGINFLIMAVGAFTCGILPQARNKPLWLAGGLVGSYLLTLAANTVRIAIAVWLSHHPIAVDPAQLHRIEGSLVYLIFLFAFYSLAQNAVKRHAR